jgi:hypothetical protein
MNSEPDALRILLLTPMPELCDWFCDQLGCKGDEDGRTLTVLNRNVMFSAAHDPEQVLNHPADAIPLVLLRYVDIMSLQVIRELLDARDDTIPSLVLLYREEIEADFKMSCPYCGQKLWVRDADQDKRGKCPHCNKGFTLPAQEELVATSLGLPASIPIRRIVREDDATLLSHLRLVLNANNAASTLKILGLGEVNKNKTMKVSLDAPPAED